jgi:SOS-response transcriptional repressor LexA
VGLGIIADLDNNYFNCCPDFYCPPIMGKKMMRKKLTSKQDEVLRALVLFVRQHRRQPSVKELSAIVGSKNVQRHLLELELRGWIKSSGKPRAIEIPEDVYDCIVETGEAPKQEQEKNGGDK